MTTEIADPAAVFASAFSLWQACQKHAEADKNLNLSECYNGMDEFMREVMRVANLFESWACSHVDFNSFDDVWPYLLQDKFGETCLEAVPPDELAGLSDADCFRVALRLRLPLIPDDKLPIPVDLAAPNPAAANSPFKKFRIQTVRESIEGKDCAVYGFDDEPFDPEYGVPFFGLYGLDENGFAEHIADRPTCKEALELAQNLAPGIDFVHLTIQVN